MKIKPKVLVMAGYGINCEDETAFAFEQAGGRAETMHVNDIDNRRLQNYQILVFPGGFSFGDDTGAGKALANRIRHRLLDDVREFIEKGKLVLGICNGFQVLANLGLVPAIDKKYGERDVALVHNTSARYIDRWVDLDFGDGIWTRGISTEFKKASMPIAHGEGRFYASPEILNRINEKKLVAARYVEGGICDFFDLEANPNGSLDDIAGITDETGRVLGMMPHPERAISFTQTPYWPSIKEIVRREGRQMPERGDGLKLFENGVGYFK